MAKMTATKHLIWTQYCLFETRALVAQAGPKFILQRMRIMCYHDHLYLVLAVAPRAHCMLGIWLCTFKGRHTHTQLNYTPVTSTDLYVQIFNTSHNLKK